MVLKVFAILSRFALGSVLVDVDFMWVVVVVKLLFMIFAIISSSPTISLIC